MAKSADAFRSIGEVARLIGVAPHVLRYWETQFPQLAPVKRADGRRYYRPDDVRLAAGLCEVMRDDGMTARGALRLMAEDRGAALRARGAERVQALLEAEAGGGRAVPKQADARKKVAAKARELPLFGDGLDGADATLNGTGLIDEPAVGDRPVRVEPAAASPVAAPPVPNHHAPAPSGNLGEGVPGTILYRLTALSARVSTLPAAERSRLQGCRGALRALTERAR